jgi:hypothetical protein
LVKLKFKIFICHIFCRNFSFKISWKKSNYISEICKKKYCMIKIFFTRPVSHDKIMNLSSFSWSWETNNFEIHKYDCTNLFQIGNSDKVICYMKVWSEGIKDRQNFENVNVVTSSTARNLKMYERVPDYASTIMRQTSKHVTKIGCVPIIHVLVDTAQLIKDRKFWFSRLFAQGE